MLILFETPFVLIYGLAWEQRLEVLAFVLLVDNVITCLLAHGEAVAPIGSES